VTRRVLFAMGYDGLIYMTADAVIGHVLFQRRGDELHAFATAVSDAFARRGYGTVTCSISSPTRRAAPASAGPASAPGAPPSRGERWRS